MEGTNGNGQLGRDRAREWVTFSEWKEYGADKGYLHMSFDQVRGVDPQFFRVGVERKVMGRVTWMARAGFKVPEKVDLDGLVLQKPEMEDSDVPHWTEYGLVGAIGRAKLGNRGYAVTGTQVFRELEDNSNFPEGLTLGMVLNDLADAYQIGRVKRVKQDGRLFYSIR